MATHALCNQLPDSCFFFFIFANKNELNSRLDTLNEFFLDIFKIIKCPGYTPSHFLKHEIAQTSTDQTAGNTL